MADERRLRLYQFAYATLGLTIAAALVAVRYYVGFPLFHLLAELFAITVAVATFMVTWNARRHIDNGYLLLLGIAYLFAAGIDTLHAVSYRGMNLIPGTDSNVPTQLWIAARYIQASAIALAPLFVSRKVRPALALVGYAAASTLLVTLIGFGLFPDAFIEGGGLTTFKIGSEYAVIVIMIIGLVLLLQNRGSFEAHVHRLLEASIAVTVASELAFTIYIDVYGPANMTGHLLRILAYFLLYRAIVALALERPYEVLYHDLYSRAESLRQSEERLRSTFDEASLGIAHITPDGTFSSANPGFAAITGYSMKELVGMRPEQIVHHDDRMTDVALTRTMLAGDRDEARYEVRFVRKTDEVVWVGITRNILRDVGGKPSQIVMMAEDVSSRRAAEHRLQSEANLNAALTEIDRTVLSTFNIDDILARVVEMAGDAMGAESAAVVVQEQTGWVVRHAYRFPEDIVGQSFPDTAVGHGIEAQQRGEPVAIRDAYVDERVDGALMRRFGIRAVIAIPLSFRDERVGTLYLMYHRGPHVFTAEERDFASKLATTISVSVENARLYETERHIADTLQGALVSLPDEIRGLDVAHAYRSATQLARIGGDFFDVFEISRGTAVVIIGDVSGKGIEAATFTAMARSTIRAFVHSYDAPGAALTAANLAITAQTGEVRFVTAVLMIIDLATGRARVACAGHPAPILCSANGCEDDHDERNPPLGVVPEQRFTDYEIVMSPGDLLVLFSDGLIDARRGTDSFGEEGVRTVLDELGGAKPQMVVERLLARSQAHADGIATDDVAVLAIRYLGLGQ